MGTNLSIFCEGHESSIPIRYKAGLTQHEDEWDLICSCVCKIYMLENIMSKYPTRLDT